MGKFRAIIPVPAVCANEHLLKLVDLSVASGDTVQRGQKMALLESDKTTFEFECPAEGTIREVHGKPGDSLRVNLPFITMDTDDETLRHLEAKPEKRPPKASVPPSKPAKTAGEWTHRALKLAMEAGLDPSKVTDIEATGPGGRISGDDVTRYLKSQR